MFDVSKLAFVGNYEDENTYIVEFATNEKQQIDLEFLNTNSYLECEVWLDEGLVCFNERYKEDNDEYYDRNECEIANTKENQLFIIEKLIGLNVIKNRKEFMKLYNERYN